MIAAKSFRFFRDVLYSRPRSAPGIVMRRVEEALRRAPSGVATTRFGDVRFDVDLSMHRITQKYYFHTHEMYLEESFHRTLRPGDIFIDIGANIGYWSAFALSKVGRSGEVHAFEPVPAFFRSVDGLRRLNPDFSMFANPVACGDRPGKLPMAVVQPTPENYNNFDTNIGSSSVLPGFLDHERGLTESIEVDIITLDSYLAEHEIDIERIGLIKIDVEGYESYCFDGMKTILEKKGRKVPILCELLTDPERHEKLDARAIIQRLEGHGYRCLNATTLSPPRLEALQFEENVLFLDKNG